MNKKNLTMVIVLLAIVFIFSSCPGVEIPSITQGILLSVDSEGHFTSDIVYNLGSTTFTYGEDGSYGKDTVDADGNTTGGYRGTYSWDSETMILTTVYTQYWDSVESRSWTSYTDPVNETMPYYFSEQRLGEVYLLKDGTDNTFEWESVTVYEDGSIYTKTISVEISSTSFIYNYTYTTTDSSGTTTYGYAEHVEGTIDNLYPAGVTWAAGNTVTVSITQTSGQTRYWDTGTDAWDSWTDITDFTKDLMTYNHMGSYIISLSGTDWLPFR